MCDSSRPGCHRLPGGMRSWMSASRRGVPATGDAELRLRLSRRDRPRSGRQDRPDEPRTDDRGSRRPLCHQSRIREAVELRASCPDQRRADDAAGSQLAMKRVRVGSVGFCLAAGGSHLDAMPGVAEVTLLRAKDGQELVG